MRQARYARAGLLRFYLRTRMIVEPEIVAGATRNVPPQEERNGVKTITVPVEGLNFASCAQSIEKRLGTFSGVREVAASYVTQTATITFDERVMSETTLRELVSDCGFACGETCDPARMLAQAAVSSSATQAPAPPLQRSRRRQRTTMSTIMQWITHGGEPAVADGRSTRRLMALATG